MNTHLTHEQLSDLLIADATICDLDLPQLDTDQDVELHLLACDPCREELSALRNGLCGFREASVLHAEAHAQLRPFHHQPMLSTRREPIRYRSLALWSACAAALVMTISTQLPHTHPQPAVAPVITASAKSPAPVPHTTESDEALLSSIDQDLSASIPSSMQPLADPLASEQAASSTSK